jgi:hypothetical protein
MKTKNFLYNGCEVTLNRPSAYPMDLSDLVRDAFDDLYRRGISYRAKGVVLMEMCSDFPVQYSLRGEFNGKKKHSILW